METMAPFNPLPGGVFEKFTSPMSEGTCDVCGLPMSVFGRGFKIPSVKGTFCSMACLETGLFGHQACRWCGAEMEKAYTSIDSRLCSYGCSQNYYAQVLGNRKAELGSCRRLFAWLQRNRPAIHRELLKSKSVSDHCQNIACPNGEGGMPASLSCLRAGAKFCSPACRMQYHRSPNHDLGGPNTPVFIEDSRNASAEMVP